PVGIEQWLIVFGIGLIGTAAPIVLFFRGLDRIEASHASIIGTSEPMATVLLGVALLGETITPIIIAGGALVLSGVVLIQRESRRAETVTQ
ncbi:EamA family transporter, partial [Halobacteriales archaeon QS_4_62_28]